MTMLQWAHMGVRVPAGMCSAIWTNVSSSLGWGWGTGRAGTTLFGTLALPLPFILKDGVIKPLCGLRPEEGGGELVCVGQWSEKKTFHKNRETPGHWGCVCVCACLFLGALYDLYSLCLHTQQVSWRCIQLADNHGFTTSVSAASFTFHTFRRHKCMNTQD